MAEISQKQVQKAEIAYRRKLVGSLYLAHVGQDEIARRLKVDQSTVSRDLKFLKRSWTDEAVGSVADFIVRELAELNEMESQAAIEFGQKTGKNPRWLLARLRIKEKKYLLLGLDKKVIELRGNVQVENIEAVREKRWKSVEKSIAEVLFEESLKQDVSLSSYNIDTIEAGDNVNNLD